MKIKRIMFLFSLILVIFFIMILTINCYASTEDDTASTTLEFLNKYNVRINKSLYDNYRYVLVLVGENKSSSIAMCFVVFSNNEIYFDSLGGRLYISGESYYKSFVFNNNFLDISNLTESDFGYYTNKNVMIPNSLVSSGYLTSKNNSVACHSSADIYNYDSNGKGDLVFQAAPHQVGLISMMKSVNFLEVLKELMMILPIVLPVVIGLLALRKAIHLLFQVLHKA